MQEFRYAQYNWIEYGDNTHKNMEETRLQVRGLFDSGKPATEWIDVPTVYIDESPYLKSE